MTATTSETVTITLTEQQLQVVSAALAELPFKVAAPLIQDLTKQIGEQRKPRAVDAAE